MGYYRKWKPSKTATREFAEKMNEISSFCNEHNISQSARGDSYYFEIGDQKYRVSNHSIEASNRHAYDEFTGIKLREEYHPDTREKDTIYIHASKTRIIEIYDHLLAGKRLDGRGNVID